MIKAYKNISYQRKSSFERFWKTLLRKKEKNPILLYPGLRYTQKKLNYACNQFAVEKKFLGVVSRKNIGGSFKNTLKIFCRRHQKIASHTFSIYGNSMIRIFLTKFFFFIYRILLQNKRKNFRKFDDTILAKCMKFVWLVFFHKLVYGIVWLAFGHGDQPGKDAYELQYIPSVGGLSRFLSRKSYRKWVLIPIKNYFYTTLQKAEYSASEKLQLDLI